MMRNGAPAARVAAGSAVRLLATLGLLTLTQISAAGPALAHGGGESVAELSTPAEISRVVALVAAVLLAGVALLRPLTGRPSEAAGRIIATAASGGVLAAGAGVLADLSFARYALLAGLIGLAALATFAGPPASLGRVAAGAAPVFAGGALVVWLCWDAVRDGVGEAALMLGHVAVAAVWVAAILAAATAPAGNRRVLIRRLTPVAALAAVAAAGTGVLSARSYDVTVDGITTTSFGSLVLLKSALLVLIALLGLGLWAVLGRSSRCEGEGRVASGLARVELSAAVGAVLAGVVLTSLPSPGPAPITGVPLARALTVDEATTGLLVSPHRPGVNLVHLMTDSFSDVVVDGRRYPTAVRPGTQGRWAELALPAGRVRLEVRQGSRVVQQVLDPGSVTDSDPQSDLDPSMIAGPDGPECASAALGAALAGSRAPLAACPSQALAGPDADALRALVGNLAGRRAQRILLIADGSPRGLAAERAVRDAAADAGISVAAFPGPDGAGADGSQAAPDAVLAVAGWEATATALTGPGLVAPTYGTYLAPWLMQASIVAAAGGAPLAALPFDPAGADARRYIAALRAVGPEQSATASGLAAFLAVAGGPSAPPVAAAPVLYAATRGFDVMPGASGGPGSGMAMGMDHGGPANWLAGGSLTPVSGRLPVPRAG